MHLISLLSGQNDSLEVNFFHQKARLSQFLWDSSAIDSSFSSHIALEHQYCHACASQNRSQSALRTEFARDSRPEIFWIGLLFARHPLDYIWSDFRSDRQVLR